MHLDAFTLKILCTQTHSSRLNLSSKWPPTKDSTKMKNLLLCLISRFHFKFIDRIKLFTKKITNNNNNKMLHK